MKKNDKYIVEVNTAVCKGCGYCKEVCVQKVFETSEKFNTLGYLPNVAAHVDKCIGCLRCLYVCPDFAIIINEIANEGEPACQ
ncbi:4Fe-4S dicluster domain-containing protein [Desulfoscipio sp. XC116]|uniref:4Fe-4S dicluster domain-containing protein n=1 Tax=Desulfoscipio sp. XC116 TaxID=3144975 RepID=UPI00325A8EF2